MAVAVIGVAGMAAAATTIARPAHHTDNSHNLRVRPAA